MSVQEPQSPKGGSNMQPGADTSEIRQQLMHQSMEELTEGLMENVCDHICKYSHQMQQEELDQQCAECRLAPYVAAIISKGG